jgi:iron complex transport system ATP-binding protein
MLQVHELHFRYKNTAVLTDVRIELNKGEVLSIVGPNGAGKTTLLKCIVRIFKPDAGRVLINGIETGNMRRIDLAKCVGYVPQSSPSKFPIAVFDAVLMGRRPYVTWKPSKKDLQIVADLLKVMGLEEFALRDFDQLSGGQKQKVLLARAFAQDTHILLLDEPTSNLDLRHQLEVMEMISRMVKKKGAGAILAVHDLNLASRFSDTIVMLNAGKIFCKGRPRDVMTAENIRAVYGVEVTINQDNGAPYILPIRAVEQTEVISD